MLGSNVTRSCSKAKYNLDTYFGGYTISPWDVRWQWRSVSEELQRLRQWVVWRYEWRKGRWTKVPYTVDGLEASSTDPRTWSTFLKVCVAADEIGRWDGIGFVFSPDDPYCGIDLDYIWQSDADEGIGWGWRIIEKFGDTYAEESPSETGFKIWCRAKLPAQGRKWNMGAGRRIEIFDRGRFFTVTGISNEVPVIVDHQDDVLALLADLDGIEQRKKAFDNVKGFHDHHGHHHHDHHDHHDPRIDLPYQRHYYEEKKERHYGLISTAGWWKAIGLGIDEIRPMLIAFDQTNCHPPKQDLKELEGILDWIAGRPG